MFSFLLAVIYLSFISLGLPDSLLGAGWPVMHAELGAPLSYAGAISVIISCGTIISSLASDKLTKKLSAGAVCALSIAMTAAALFGFSVSGQFWQLCLWAVPYGFGAGAVDAALNNYVALHYSSRHMSWLHAFWGVGVSVSPYIMSFCLVRDYGWSAGYRTVAVIQVCIALCVFFSLPMWKKRSSADREESENSKGLLFALRIKGAPYAFLSFLFYCAFESTAGLWSASYMAGARGVDAESAARFAALYYLGITFGRFLCGFISDRAGDDRMVRAGVLLMGAGTLMLLLPLGTNIPSLAGLVMIGAGSAPVYPCIIHSTPKSFGAENSQAMVGIQMACAYLGTTLFPPLFGIIAENITVAAYPWFLLLLCVMLALSNECRCKSLAKNKKTI